jgi:hypothetical protein
MVRDQGEEVPAEKKKRRRHRSAATAQAKAKLQKSIRRGTARVWNDYLKTLTGAEV